MKKSILWIFAGALLLGGIAFGVVAVWTWHSTPEVTEISDYGMMPFYAFSSGTESDETQTAGSTPLRYIEYRSEDGRFSFFREVSEQAYFDFDIAKETEAEYRPLQRYVYIYYLNGEPQTIIQEQELNDNQLREIIGNTNRVSAWQYAIFAGILLIAAGYFLYLAARRPKKGMQKQNG